MSSSTKVGIGLLIVLIALMVAIWPRGDDGFDAGSPATPNPPGDTQSPVDEDALASARVSAGLVSCPPSGEADPGAPAAGPLAGLVLECLGDGSAVDLGAALAGKPAVVNLWAYWCAPCREELPAMAEYAARAGDEVTVLTVNKDNNQEAALDLLAELGVRLPGVQDGGARVAAAVGAPNVLPVTVLVRADGSVAAVLAVPFANADEIAAAVAQHLGVSS